MAPSLHTLSHSQESSLSNLLLVLSHTMYQAFAGLFMLLLDGSHVFLANLESFLLLLEEPIKNFHALFTMQLHNLTS